jgi:hypothetical protein
MSGSGATWPVRILQDDLKAIFTAAIAVKQPAEYPKNIAQIENRKAL